MQLFLTILLSVVLGGLITYGVLRKLAFGQIWLDGYSQGWNDFQVFTTQAHGMIHEEIKKDE